MTQVCPPFCCVGANCQTLAKFVCRRCKIAKYCSLECQIEHWCNHKDSCNWIDRFWASYEFKSPCADTTREWSVAKMQNGPVQASEPPVTFPKILTNIWREKEFSLNGKVVVKASMLTPQVKYLIQLGIKQKVLSWEYLASDNFLQLAAHPMVPLKSLLYLIENYMLKSILKAKSSAQVEIITQDFWKIRTIYGQTKFNPAVVLMLYRLGIKLPSLSVSRVSDEGQDELRVLTHGTIEDCQCYHCLVRPFLEAKRQELWENMRQTCYTEESKQIMTLTAVRAYQQQVFDAYLWDIDSTGPGEFRKWDFRPDDMAENEAYIKFWEADKLCEMVNTLQNETRDATDKELSLFRTLADITRLPSSFHHLCSLILTPITNTMARERPKLTINTSQSDQASGVVTPSPSPRHTASNHNKSDNNKDNANGSFERQQSERDNKRKTSPTSSASSVVMSMSPSGLRRGKYQPDEDKVILQKVHEWSEKDDSLETEKELWMRIGALLRRRPEGVHNRWTDLTSDKRSVDSDITEPEVSTSDAKDSIVTEKPRGGDSMVGIKSKPSSAHQQHTQSDNSEFSDDDSDSDSDTEPIRKVDPPVVYNANGRPVRSAVTTVTSYSEVNALKGNKRTKYETVPYSPRHTVSVTSEDKTRNTVSRRPYKCKKGMLVHEDEVIIRQKVAECGGALDASFWMTVGEMLQRKPETVRRHWDAMNALSGDEHDDDEEEKDDEEKEGHGSDMKKVAMVAKASKVVEASPVNDRDATTAEDTTVSMSAKPKRDVDGDSSDSLELSDNDGDSDCSSDSEVVRKVEPPVVYNANGRPVSSSVVSIATYSEVHRRNGTKRKAVPVSTATTSESVEDTSPRYKKGNYSRQEDETIRQRVAAWSMFDEDQDTLWEGLEKELNRRGESIKMRWTTLSEETPTN